jgi:hypothetical protein
MLLQNLERHFDRISLLPFGPAPFTSIPSADDIIQYLFTEYGDGQVPLGLRLGAATTVSCGLALAPR